MHSASMRSSALFLTAYVVAVLLGRQTVLEEAGLAMFWPAAGVAVLWMLHAKDLRVLRRDAAALFLSTLIINVLLAVPVDASVFFGLANLVQGLAVRVVLAHLMRVRWTGPIPFVLDGVRALTQLFVVCVLASVASSLLGGTAALLASGGFTGSIQLAWVVRNTCGSFVVAAVALTLTNCLVARARNARGGSLLTGERRPRAGAELVVVVAITLGLVLLIFADEQPLPLTFAAFAASVWAGFRFSPAIAALHSAGLGLVVVLLTLASSGPFGAIEQEDVRAVVTQLFVGTNTVIVLLLSLGVAERQQLTQVIRASEAMATQRAGLLDAITRSMSEALIVVTGTGQVTMSNPAALSLASADVRRTAQLRLEDLRTPDGRPLEAAEAPHLRVIAGEDVPPMDVLHRDPVTGAEQVLSVTTVPLRAEGGGSAESAVLVIRDVTRERGRERELQAYAGVVAHDLRAPLGALKSWAEILDEQLDDLGVDVSAAKTSLIRIFGTADRMQELIGDLLDYAQAQSAEVHPQRIELGRLVSEIGGDLADATQAGRNRPVITHGLLDDVVADPTLTRQLVANLIGNAVKYVSPGTVPHVRVHTVRDGAWVEVRVSDNGIGIPDEARGRVFESFVRASSGSYTGTGLGLSICAKAVERHGGRIYATSGPGGQGTTMVFTLPAADLTDPGPDASDLDSTELDGREGQREERTTRADPPPRRTGSATAVS